MTKLEKLIQEFCPDGVEFRPLEQCCNILDRKRKPVTKSSREAGKYPYYGANGIQDYVSDYIFDGTFILVGEDGSVITDRGTPVVTWASGKIWVNNHAHIIEGNGTVLLRFLYHYIQTIDVSPLIHGNIPKLTGGDFRALTIPVPPLEVQREIVRILDTFTELTGDLTEILSKEFIARKQQYAYYRDMLLTHSSKTKICKLVDICESIADGDHMPPPKASDGVPFITISNITEQNKIDFSNTMFVPRSYYDALADKRKPHSGDILYTVVGSYGIPVCIEQDSEFVFQRHIAILRPRPENIKARYMFHAMQSSAFKAQADKAAKGAAQKTIGLSSLAEMTLPVPDMHVQERLIHVLDNFDTICSDLNIGLSDEIEARKKQYEFYRDQLLAFAAQDEIVLTDRQTDRQTDEYNALIRLCQYVFGYVTLEISDICNISRGKVISKTDIMEQAGTYPVYSSQTENNGELGKIDSYMFDGEYVTWTTDGANAGTVFYRYGKFNITNVCGLLSVMDSSVLLEKYLFYFLQKNAGKYVNAGMGNPKLMSNVMASIKIDIPSLSEQKRIIAILDHFSTLCTDLSSGLPAEIEARQKQYEYYRDNLLSFTPAD